MSFRTADYLEKLLYRSAILERPLAAAAAVAAASSGGGGGDDECSGGSGSGRGAQDAEVQDTARELAEQAREQAREAAFSTSVRGARVARDAQQMRAAHWK